MSFDHREKWYRCERCNQSYSDADKGCDDCGTCGVEGCGAVVAIDDLCDFGGLGCCPDCYKTLKEIVEGE